jgi:hypothetical protein
VIEDNPWAYLGTRAGLADVTVGSCSLEIHGVTINSFRVTCVVAENSYLVVGT